MRFVFKAQIYRLLSTFSGSDLLSPVFRLPSPVVYLTSPKTNKK